MYRKYIKRIIDIVMCLVGLPIFALIFIVVAPLIFFEDKGTVFYNAERLGKNGKIFKMYKFRSMKVNALDIRNADGSTYNGDNDVRVTRIGRILRKTSLDEIPQILNVLKGDMSIIGPRAHLTTHFECLDKLDSNQRKRLEVRPGITGYNQAYFRNSVDFKQKVKNDVFYVENMSFFLDLKILIKTFVSVVRKENIYNSNVAS